MRQLVAILLFATLTGCAESLVMPTDGMLTHDEAVAKMKQEMKDNIVFCFYRTEKRVSPTVTRLWYQHTTPQPPPSLYTPAFAFDWTTIDIDTANKGEVRLYVKTYRQGNFVNERQREIDSEIVTLLSARNGRANKTPSDAK